MSLAGLEPATDGVETRRSVQLSYSDKVWSARVELNHRQSAYKAEALTTELRAMELMDGIEPSTCDLGDRRSVRLSYINEVWGRNSDSNRRPAAYKAAALAI